MPPIQPAVLRPDRRQSNRAFQQLVGICALLAVVVFISPLVQQSGFPAFSIIDGFLGASLQAFAFLAIGVLASAAVQVFISDRALRRIFPASAPAAVAVALLISLILPVCDCSSIPLFRSFVQRRIPRPAAVTFLLAAPVVNPLVVWSTYFAFNGDWSVVLCRLLVGLAVATVVGLSFLIGNRTGSVILRPDDGGVGGAGAGRASVGIDGGDTAKGNADSSSTHADSPGRVSTNADADTVVSTSTNSLNHQPARPHFDHVLSLYDPAASFRQRLAHCLAHARADFFDIARYLVLGIGLASLFKNLNSTYSLVDFSGLSPLLGIAVMMAAGYVLSLCSSSDAVIGRIFASQMPLAPVLAFLVFGPMLDIKNTLMLGAHFKRGFIIRLGLSAFAVTGLLIGLLSLTGVLA